MAKQSKKEDIKIEYYLAIVETQEDAVLIVKRCPETGNRVCKKCAEEKLKVIRFCEISIEDAEDLMRPINGIKVRSFRVRCDCKKR